VTIISRSLSRNNQRRSSPTGGQCSAAINLLTLALPGVEAGEEASRLEFGIVELISFDYRPAV